MFFQLNITQLWSRNDETKMHADPGDSFTFYSSLSSQSFGAIQVQENFLHLAKFAICNTDQYSLQPCASLAQSCLKLFLQ